VNHFPAVLKLHKPELVQQGKVYLYDGRPYRAGLVNACRCRLDPLYTVRRIINDHLHMKVVEIRARPPSLSLACDLKLPPVIVR
jgi:hypothetical protein